MKSTRISIDALERQLVTLTTLVDEIVPPAPAIVTTNEAHAVRQYLVAYACGEVDAFWRQQKRDAALVVKVSARRGVAEDVDRGLVSGTVEWCSVSGGASL